MRLLTFLFLPLLCAFLLVPPTLSLHLYQHFTISDTCSSRESELDDMLDQTVKLAENAIKALETLLKGGEELSAKAGVLENLSLVVASHRAFGVRGLDTYKDGFDEAEKSHLSMAKSNFEALKKALVTDYTLVPAANFFHCDDSRFVRVTKATDIAPKAPKDATARDYLKEYLKWPADAPDFDAAWKDLDHRIVGGSMSNFALDDENGASICDPKSAEAQVQITGKLTSNMFFCPSAFDTDKFKADLSALQPPVSANEPPKRVAFDSVRTRAGLFLHEMMHRIRVDPPIVDVPLKVKVRGKRLKWAYGLRGAYALAHYQGEDGFKKTLTNADTYNVFATTVYAANLLIGS